MKLCLIRNEIADLNTEPVLRNYSLSQLKRAADILIIDDDPFTYEDALKKNEFMIEYKSDIQTLKEIEITEPSSMLLAHQLLDNIEI